MGDLTYRAIGPGDFDALHGIVSHWAVVRQPGGWPWPANPSFTQGRCKPYTGTGFVHGVCLDGKLIGSMAVTGGELGYICSRHKRIAGGSLHGPPKTPSHGPLRNTIGRHCGQAVGMTIQHPRVC